MNIEEITDCGKSYTEAKNKVESIKETIKMIDREDIGFYAKLEIEFKGMYRRSSKSFGVTDEEIKDILNNRLSAAIENRNTIKKQFDKIVK